MNNSEIQHASGDLRGIASCVELEQRLNSLSALVCDLLRANQELRHALVEAAVNVRNDQGYNSQHTMEDPTNLGE